MMKKNILDYDFPKDIKSMSLREMEILAVQIREFLIDRVSKTGGHLSSNLGTVELSIALHHFFDTPKDKIVWDVGHQTYPHKILTNRGKYFDTLRKIDGLSGFPKRKESEYDTYDTGHSSNSISIATGFAVARDLKREDHEVIAVIGDGALTGGMAYEALNNLGELKSKAIIIVNDNGMSIGKNTGGMSKHLGKIRLSKGYRGFKNKMGKILKGISEDTYHKAVHLRDKLKYGLVDGVFFEELGLRYIGVIDGHDIEELIQAFEMAKQSTKSVVIHIETVKGKGYKNAENNPSKFHGVSPFNKSDGTIISNKKEYTYSNAFGDTVLELAEKDDKIIAISAAMIEGTGLEKFESRFPHRTFDVGIAEAHGITFAGSLALSGMKPVIPIYSTFLQRAYDQIITDIALQNANVLMGLDRAGVVGADGETHHGIFDISYLKNIPNLRVYAPTSKNDMKHIIENAMNVYGPVAIRYPRGKASEYDENYAYLYEQEDGIRDRIIKKGKDGYILALGNMVETSIQVSKNLQDKGIDIGVVAVKCISPIDEITLNEIEKDCRKIITVEDGIVDGGYGHSVRALLNNKEFLHIGWNKKFIPHGDVKELMAREGMSADKMTERIEKFVER